MMCCKVPYLQEFEKPPGVWCSHTAAGKGCMIYASRPASCQAFYCQWMVDASLGPEWKPDRAKFVLYLQRNGVNLQVSVDPGFPQAWTRPPYYGRLKQWALEGAERGAFVFVRIGRMTTKVVYLEQPQLAVTGDLTQAMLNRVLPADRNLLIEADRVGRPMVLVRIGGRMIALLPDRDEDIGEVGLDDEVMVARRRAPTGFTYEVEVIRCLPSAPSPHPLRPAASARS